jgi:hypothetical protein
MRKLIEGNKDIPRETLKIHMDNLWQMVRYSSILTKEYKDRGELTAENIFYHLS